MTQSADPAVSRRFSSLYTQPSPGKVEVGKLETRAPKLERERKKTDKKERAEDYKKERKGERAEDHTPVRPSSERLVERSHQRGAARDNRSIGNNTNRTVHHHHQQQVARWHSHPGSQRAAAQNYCNRRHAGITKLNRPIHRTKAGSNNRLGGCDTSRITTGSHRL